MLPPLVSVFDVSDDDQEFASYLDYLRDTGVHGRVDEWLQLIAQGLLGADPDKSQGIGPEWTPRRRRLLVALTWSDPQGAIRDRDSYFDGDELEPFGYSGLKDRPYDELWQDIAVNLTALAHRAHDGGPLGYVKDPHASENDIFLKAANLGLITTVFGRQVASAIVEALRSRTRETRIVRAQQGFLVTWWDLVAMVESTGFHFERRPAAPSKRRLGDADGRYLWEQSQHTLRVQDAELRAQGRRGAVEMHERITASGRIEPPKEGSKYRRLFEFLDNTEADTFTLRAEELHRLVSAQADTNPLTSHHLGLPASALKNPQWWYGPWNPEQADPNPEWNVAQESTFRDLMLKKSQTRAWMAAGFRAHPRMRTGSGLGSVTFRAVEGRRWWWPHRRQLRAGASDLVDLSLP